MRVAVIDIGSNSVLLLAVESKAGVVSTVLRQEQRITRLGRGVDATGVLSEAGLADTCAAVAELADLARSCGVDQVRATSTSAARDARNGHALIERCAEFGVPVEILSGAEEARLSWRSVADDLGRDGAPLAVIDVGGGSTEVIIGAGPSWSFRHSFDIGAVRLTERLRLPEVLDDAGRERLWSAARAALQEIPSAPTGTRVVGVAGTFTTLGAIALGMREYDGNRLHGAVFELDAFERTVDALSAMPLEARKAVAGLDPKRADVIVAGGAVACAAARRLGASQVVLSDRGLRWGVLTDWLERIG